MTLYRYKNFRGVKILETRLVRAVELIGTVKFLTCASSLRGPDTLSRQYHCTVFILSISQ